MALIESIQEHEPSAVGTILALDEITKLELLEANYRNISIITLAEVEAHFCVLEELKLNRSSLEYIFTLTPFLLNYVLKDLNEGAWITYLDADTYMLESSATFRESLDGYSVAIVPHNFSTLQRWRNRYGKYNVGWVGFRNDHDGRVVLEWWLGSCAEWCFNSVEWNRYADQKYLDFFEQKSLRVQVVLDAGINAGPWSLRRHSVNQRSDGKLCAGSDELVLYHFHGIQETTDRYYFKLFTYLAPNSSIRKRVLYEPYLARVYEIKCRLALTDSESVIFASNSGGARRTLRTVLVRWVSWIRGDYVNKNMIIESEST